MTDQISLKLENSNSFKNVALIKNSGKNFYMPANNEPVQNQDTVTITENNDEEEYTIFQRKNLIKREILH